MTTTRPSRVEDVQDILRGASAIVFRGGGTKAPGDAVDEISTLETTGLAGITAYEPSECVLTVGAGTRLSAIEDLLASHGQHLPFDPPFRDAGATIGGTVTAGLSGPGRYRYGGVRDFVVGVQIVDGEGRAIRSGGRVVKNAAGFLLHHAVVGSWGSFGVLTEVSLKVFPAPQARVSMRVECGSLAAAIAAQRAAEEAHVDLAAIDCDSAGTVWIRLAGSDASLSPRLEKLGAALAAHALAVVDGPEELTVWENFREFRWASPDVRVIKVPVTPARAPVVVVAVAEAAAACRRGVEPGFDDAPIRFSAGASMAWIAWPFEVDDLSRRLASARLSAVIVRGSGAGRRLGLIIGSAFEARVRRVMDPAHKIRAASHSPS
jgi:glycolate oxidase FAD binding subunit